MTAGYTMHELGLPKKGEPVYCYNYHSLNQVWNIPYDQEYDWINESDETKEGWHKDGAVAIWREKQTRHKNITY